MSPGCTNCYAARTAARFNKPGEPYDGLAYFDDQKRGQWTGKIMLVEDQVDRPLRWRRPRKVFVNSMSDLFHEKVPIDFIVHIFAVMALANRHTFQVLTKRASWMQRVVGDPAFRDMVEKQAAAIWHNRGGDARFMPWTWPLPNVWLGTSAEDQKRYDERAFHLARTPAAVRFVSFEPLLGPIRIHPDDPRFVSAAPFLHWGIVGGESGPGARPMDIEWARGLVRDLQAWGIAAWYKQGGVAHPCEHSKKGECGDCVPDDLKVRQFPGVPA